MLMKRIYKTPEGWEKRVDENGDCTNPPPLDYISVAHTGLKPEQNFSTRMVARGQAEGWMVIDCEADTLTIEAYPEDLVYAINQYPGKYCLNCGHRTIDDPSGVQMRAHTAGQHAGEESPDPQWPHGYAQFNEYRCTLSDAQHAKYRKRSDQAAVHEFPRKPKLEDVSNG